MVIITAFLLLFICSIIAAKEVAYAGREDVQDLQQAVSTQQVPAKSDDLLFARVPVPAAVGKYEDVARQESALL